jgi:DNA modification methylase
VVTTAVKHPAPYSRAILDAIQRLLPSDRSLRLLDPFAGTGSIHELGFASVGVEIRPAWAAMHPRTVNADATRLPFADNSFDLVATSPVYPTGMTDAFTARDGSDRLTYMHRYGALIGERNPSNHPNDLGASNARRDARRYWALSEKAWKESLESCAPKGCSS